MLVLLVSLAFAGDDDCPWTEIESVSSSMTKVWINGEMIPVVGRTNWSLFERDLRECDLDRAAADLQRWRQKRRQTNSLFGWGWVLWPLWIGTPFSASAAGRWRGAMEGELLAWDGPEWTPARPIEVVEKATEAVGDVVE